MNFRAQQYETPLMMAIKDGNLDMMKLLLSKNANVNASNKVNVVQEGRSCCHGLQAFQIIVRRPDVCS